MRPTERGFVTLAALLDVLIITLIGAILMTSLFGEIQGEFGYNEAVTATAIAEAGLHWAGKKLTGTSLATQFYAGDSNQTVQSAGGQQAGVFTVTVKCTDGSLVNVGLCATAPALPNQRLITSTGYVPSPASPLGQRTLRAIVGQNTFYNKTICTYTSLNLNSGVQVQGDVGSEGTTNPDLQLQGSSGNTANIVAAPLNCTTNCVQPGSAYAVSTVSCSQNCNGQNGQVAGTVYNGQAAGTVCPNRTVVYNSYAPCTPGSASFSGGTINGSNNSLSTITLASTSTVTFDTTGINVLTVNVNSITAGSNTQFIVKGNGIVQLIVASQMTVGQGSYFGVDPSGNVLPAGRLVVESCNTGTPSPAVWFNQTGKLSAVFIVPYGDVKMDQAQNSQGAILANNVLFDQGTGFGFDTSASAIGTGFNTMVSWQDVP
jgi:hypothetical protein